MYSIKEVTVQDQPCTLITVHQPSIEVSFLNYGAAIYSLKVPDQNGTMEDIVIGYESLDDYWQNNRHVNATIGPTAGRIENGEFTLDGQTIKLDKNMNNMHTLHGGKDALSYSMFEHEVLDEEDRTEVVFSCYKHGSRQHYPGDQQYTIIYTVTPGKITIEFSAETSEPTLVNLTNHAYFNLSGNLKSNILHHTMSLKASNKMALDGMIPIGIESIVDTAYDFTTMKPIKGDTFVEIDDPYLLDTVTIEQPQATLIDPVSKRRLDVYTTYPSIVCYTDNFPMTYTLKYGAPNELYMGVCFETQNPPNGIHLDNVESSILRPEQSYYHKTVFAFSVEE